MPREDAAAVFGGLVFHLDNFSFKEKRLLSETIAQGGGKVSSLLVQKISHFVSAQGDRLSYKEEKCRQFACAIVSKEWVLKCCRCDELLPVPENLIHPPTQTATITWEYMQEDDDNGDDEESESEDEIDVAPEDTRAVPSIGLHARKSKKGLAFITGHGSHSQSVDTPCWLQTDHPVMSVACGWYVVSMITQSGIITAGKRRRGEKDSSYDDPAFLADERIVAASCGRSHTLLLRGQHFTTDTYHISGQHIMLVSPDRDHIAAKLKQLALTCISDDGRVTGIGNSSRGQIGLSRKSYRRPRTIDLKEECSDNEDRAKCDESTTAGNDPVIVWISAGGDSSAAIDEDGQLYTWGRNDKGQLGHGKRSPSESRKIVHPRAGDRVRFASVACGEDHCLALSSQGSVYAWGSNEYGKLGVPGPSASKSLWTPNLVGAWHGEARPPVVVDVGCGVDHSAALGDDGRVWGWGRGDGGRRGDGNLRGNDCAKPKVIDLVKSKIMSIACGASCTVCLAVDGCVWVWGTLRYSSYGQDAVSTFSVPQKLSCFAAGGVSEISAGGNVIMFLVSGKAALLSQFCRTGNSKGLAQEVKGLEQGEDLKALQLVHLTVQQEELECLRVLCESGWDVNYKNDEGQSPLHLACLVGSVGAVRLLLNFQADVNNVDDNLDTPLHVAARQENYNIVRDLCHSGADKFILNASGMSVLHEATVENRIHVAKILVLNAASTSLNDAQGRTPLDYCNVDIAHQLKTISDKHSCFISYAHENLELAKKVKHQLENYCVRCWMDDARLEAGIDWRSAIGEGIRDSQVVLFLASKVSVTSEWCIKELYLAKQQGKPILAVTMEDVSREVPHLDPLVLKLLHKRPGRAHASGASRKRKVLSLAGLSTNTFEYGQAMQRITSRLRLLSCQFERSLTSLSSSDASDSAMSDKARREAQFKRERRALQKCVSVNAPSAEEHDQAVEGPKPPPFVFFAADTESQQTVIDLCANVVEELGAMTWLECCRSGLVEANDPQPGKINRAESFVFKNVETAEKTNTENAISMCFMFLLVLPSATEAVHGALEQLNCAIRHNRTIVVLLQSTEATPPPDVEGEVANEKLNELLETIESHQRFYYDKPFWERLLANSMHLHQAEWILRDEIKMLQKDTFEKASRLEHLTRRMKQLQHI